MCMIQMVSCPRGRYGRIDSHARWSPLSRRSESCEPSDTRLDAMAATLWYPFASACCDHEPPANILPLLQNPLALYEGSCPAGAHTCSPTICSEIVKQP